MKEALGMLSDQLIALDEVTQLISSLKNGVAVDLETAGVIVLRMMLLDHRVCSLWKVSENRRRRRRKKRKRRR